MVLHFLLLFTLNQSSDPLPGMRSFPLSWNTVALGKPGMPAPPVLGHLQEAWHPCPPPQFWIIPQEA